MLNRQKLQAVLQGQLIFYSVIGRNITLIVGDVPFHCAQIIFKIERLERCRCEDGLTGIKLHYVMEKC
jgi:hypothetical protein